MSGILRLESLTKGNTLRQGDLTLLKYRLFDADGDKLDISGKSATVRLMKDNFTFIAYEKEGLTVASDDTISFSINKVLPGGIYFLEVIVDDKYIFPSRSDEGKFNVDKSSLGAELTIIENAGIDAVVRKAVELINEDPSLIIDEERLVNEIIANTGIKNIDEYYQQYSDVIKELSEDKDYHSLPEIAGARGGFETLSQHINEKLYKNRGAVTSADLSQEVKESMTGGSVAVVGKNAILTENIVDNQVAPEKTTFIELGKNKFDGSYVGGYMNLSGGFGYTDTDYTAFIDVEPNTTYTISKTSSYLTRVGLSNKENFSSQNTEVILNDSSGENDSGFTFTTNAEQNLLIIYVSPNDKDVPDFMQVEEGSEPTAWEEYRHLLKGVSARSIEDKVVTPEKTTFIERSQNIFDGSYESGYMNPTGAFGNTDTDRTAFIDVKPNTTYTLSKTPSYLTRVGLNNKNTFSTQHSEVILSDSSGENDSGFTFTTNSDQNLLLIYVSPNPSQIPDFMQVEEGEVATQWVEYGYELKGIATPYVNSNANDTNYFGIKGDGVTDDSDGFNAYLSHLKEQGGGRFELPKGQYVIKKTITFPSNVVVDLSSSTVLLGDSYNLSQRIWRAGSMFPYFVTEEGSENIVFSNFTLLGSKTDIRKERQVGLGVFDAKNVIVRDVNIKSVNYDALALPDFGDIVPGIGLFILRSSDVSVLGGSFDEGGYENIGTEHAKDIIIDGVQSGKAWRTSIQPHKATYNLKILNSTIYQETATPDSGALTLHGRGDLGEGMKDILISGNTIHGNFSSDPTHGYNALIQIMEAVGGTFENITITNNILKGNRTGIYGTKTDNHIIAGNVLDIEKGNGIHVHRNSSGVILDQNILRIADGIPLVDPEGVAILGTNFGL